MKNMLVVIMLVLCFGFGSAHDVWYKEKYSESKYFSEDSIVVSRTLWANYKNIDRFSTYDYRYGYSYRATKEYFERFHKFGDVKIVKIKRNVDLGDEYFNYEKPNIPYGYTTHLNNYKRKTCYINPPKDRLFYIKC